MLYIIKSAITLALLYSCFFFLLSKETFHRFNRFMLVGIMTASLIVPLLHFPTSHPTIINEEFQYIQHAFEEEEVLETASLTATTARVSWMRVLTWTYQAGVAVMLLLTLVQVISLVRLIHGGLRHTDNRGNIVVLHKGNIPPFSFLHFIVMSVKDYATHRHYILAHEQEHIRLGHTSDLFLLELVKTLQWFNPFIWFLARDLKAVHEYEADQAVINQGIDAKTYQQLLVMKVVGNRLQPFTNNLNHGSLKKRILMMYQKPSNRWLMLKALCAIPVVALTLNTFATPTSPHSVEDIVSTLENKDVSVLNGLSTPTADNLTTEDLPTEKTLTENTPSAISPARDASGRTAQDENPLIVVDGKIVNVPVSLQQVKSIEDEDMLKLLNLKSKDEIESVTVLQNASATAIYGEKGKNGVIEIKTKKASQQAETDDDPVFEVCEEIAQYPGGQPALMQFLARNLRYPKIAIENGIQGRVIVQFIVNKDGSCSNYKVVANTAHNNEGVSVTALAKKAEDAQQAGTEVAHSPEELQEMSKALEQEAIRAIQLAGKWQPAKQRGQIVRMKMNIPVTFRLQ